MEWPLFLVRLRCLLLLTEKLQWMKVLLAKQVFWSFLCDYLIGGIKIICPSLMMYGDFILFIFANVCQLVLCFFAIDVMVSFRFTLYSMQLFFILIFASVTPMKNSIEANSINRINTIMYFGVKFIVMLRLMLVAFISWSLVMSSSVKSTFAVAM